MNRELTLGPTLPVVVYGANGFIGKNLCLALAERGIETLAISRKFDPDFQGALSENVRCVRADFFDTDALFRLIPARASHVLLVSDSVPATWANEPSREVEGNLISHVRFFERLGEGNRLFFVSSGGTVYGAPTQRTPFREEDTGARPLSAHGVTKLAIEHYAAVTAGIRGYDHAILRPANPVGPWTKAGRLQGIVGVAIERYLQDMPITIWGDGSTVRDYLDVRDLVTAILSTLELPWLGGEVFNVGSGIGRSLNDVLALLQQTLDIHLEVEMKADRGFDVPYNVLDSSRLIDATGWRPVIPFRTTLHDTWSFMAAGRRETVT